MVKDYGAWVDAVFSANCGGHIRNNEAVEGFSRTPIPYLRGVPCPDPGPKNGHGLGLCQYGARAFAEQSRTFVQILAHYYQGITLERIPEKM
jgi:stage II sporulation protein D